MVFEISFYGQDSPKQSTTLRDKEIWGSIQIGTFKEDIIIPLDYWSKDDYQKQWKETILSLLQQDKAACAAFIVEMHDPRHATYINCWPIYSDGDRLYIQNRMIFLDQLTGPFDPNKIAFYIGERRTVDEDGNQISEWEVDISDLQEWLRELQ